MLCDKCKQNPATVFVTKMVNDQKTEYRLCIDCAKREQFFPAGMEAHISVDSLLKGFFGHPEQVPAAQMPNVICEVCGMTMDKLAEKGRFGCDQCYKVFGDAALRIIKQIHGRKRHIGKLPKRASGTLSMKRRLFDLRSKLEEHVLKEEYEDAAKIRDEIRLLEKEYAPVAEVKNDTK